MHIELQGICKKPCHTPRFSTADPIRIIPNLNPDLGSDTVSSDIDILAWIALWYCFVTNITNDGKRPTDFVIITPQFELRFMESVSHAI